MIVDLPNCSIYETLRVFHLCFRLKDMRVSIVTILVTVVSVLGAVQEVKSHKDQPLSGIAIHRITFDLNEKAYLKASPTVLGSNVITIPLLLSDLFIVFLRIAKLQCNFFLQGQHSELVLVEYSSPKPSDDDWIGVFSPADFK